MKNCPSCGSGSQSNPAGDSGDYLIVKATASEADPCGNPQESVSSTSACAKQEPEYDIALTGFVLPTVNNITSIDVCNNKIYSINQYIQFINQGVTMLIAGIGTNGRTITMRNACSNGATIENPDAGLAIQANAPFITVGSPPCLTDDQENQAFQAAIASATQLCTTSMIEAPEEDTVQIVGRREASSEVGFTKCIRRAFGFLFRQGSMLLPNIRQIDESDAPDYNNLVIDRSSGQTRKGRQIRDYAFGSGGLKAGFKYIFAGNQSTTKPVGPAFVFSPFIKVFEERGTFDNPDTYISINSEYSKDYSVNIPEITGLINKDLQDHYYLLIHIIGAGRANSGTSRKYLQFKINDDFVMGVQGPASGFGSSASITIPVKILNSATNFNLKITPSGNSFFYYKIRAVGAYI